MNLNQENPVTPGARITLVGGHDGTGWIMWLLSAGWLVGCTNAFNLIDGLDGMAPGVGLFATLTILLATILQGNVGLAIATVPLAGCLLAFLRYNFNPASVFLGDSGSLTIGFFARLLCGHPEPKVCHLAGHGRSSHSLLLVGSDGIRRLGICRIPYGSRGATGSSASASKAIIRSF